MKKIISAILLILFLVILIRPVGAQAQPAIANLQIDIWPEYDRPEVLVIYHITVAPDQLPTDIRVRIPAASGGPYAVANVESSGMFNIQDVEVIPDGDWLVVAFQARVPDVRIEYYDPDLKKNGSQREFVFRWGGGTAVQKMVLSIQQPPTATGMSLEPSFTQSLQGSDGYTYYTYEVGNLEVSTPPFNVTLRYSKSDDSLTNASESVQPNQPVNMDTAGRLRLDQVLPWAIGILGLILIIIGLFWYTRINRGHGTEPARHRHSRKATGGTQDNDLVAFCHKCGNKAATGDLFCRSCGTKLK